MKRILILLFITVLVCCCGNQSQQQNVSSSATEADVAAAVDRLMKGFVSADENILKLLTAEELMYGHSSGKVQNKAEFMAEILSRDPLIYVSIELQEQTIRMAGDAAVVRHIFTSETKNTEGEPGSLRIGVMQVWQLQDGMWKLLARQAYRL